MSSRGSRADEQSESRNAVISPRVLRRVNEPGHGLGAVPEPAPFTWAGALSRASAMLGGPKAVFRSLERVIKPAQLQLVRQAQTGGFGGVWTL